MNLNELRDKAYSNACAKGFHDKEYSNEHWLMLVITELSEAVEADRKDKRSSNEFFKFSSLPFNRAYDMHIKGTVDEELADAAIRLLDLAGLRGIDMDLSWYNFTLISNIFKDETFTECIYGINSLIFRLDVELESKMSETTVSVVGYIIALAKHLDIDLLWHIEQKMKYNETREPLHGKSY